VRVVRYAALPVAVSSRLPGESGLPPRLTAVRWLVAAAIGLPIAIMVAIGIVSWRATWAEAERELSRSADAVAEYLLRVFDGHRVAADRVNDLLEHLSNEQIQERERELHLRLARLLPDLPLVQTIAVSRPDGLMLFTANFYPVPPNTRIPDREWIRDLKKPDAPRTHVSKVNIGRLDANLFFGVSRRRYMAIRPAESGDDYDGVINVSIEPNRVAAGFADLVSERSDVVRVIRADGEIITQLPGFSAPLPPFTQQTRPSFFNHATSGRGRAVYQTNRRSDGGEQLVALRAIPGFPIFATVARDAGAITARFWRGFAQHLGLGIPAIVFVAAMAIFASRRAEERDRAQAAARFHAVFDATPAGLAVVDAQCDDIISCNEALAKLIGLPRTKIEGPGQRLGALIRRELMERYHSAVDNARVRGIADPFDVELVSYDRRRVPVRLAMSQLPGDPPRLVVVIQDISDVREAERRRELMMREVEHRAKNTLAVIQAALRLGASAATDAQALALAVEARVAALARSQSLLTSVGPEGASLRDLIEQEVAPFVPAEDDTGAEKLQLEGPEIRINPKAAQALTMTFHELATNAAKYGAFAQANSSARVSWRIADDEMLVLRWTEAGPHSAKGEPARVGFGTRLIDINIVHQLEGRIERHWEATGLLLIARIPVASIQASAPILA
jgi:PAS domain S-box-containing protein